MIKIAERIWPKSNGEILYASDLNTLERYGDGSDGTYNDSGNLNQGTIYQYTSFNLSDGQTLTTTSTSGKPIYVLVGGDCTIAGTINLNAKGYDGGSGGGAGQDGASGENFKRVDGSYGTPSGGSTEGSGANTDGGGGGASIFKNGDAAIDYVGGNPGNGGVTNMSGTMDLFNINVPGALQIDSGQGGGGGGAGNPDAPGGDGGNGGGSIVFVIGGDLTLGGTVTLDGEEGDVGTSGAAFTGGPGGGGGAGCLWAMYKGTLSGSLTTSFTGGTGGTGEGGSGTAGNGGSGTYAMQQIQTVPPTAFIVQNL